LGQGSQKSSLDDGRRKTSQAKRGSNDRDVMENGKANFGLAIALGIILMVLVYAVNLVLTLRNRGAKQDSGSGVG